MIIRLGLSTWLKNQVQNQPICNILKTSPNCVVNVFMLPKNGVSVSYKLCGESHAKGQFTLVQD